jgi:hypothetical protein
MVFFSKYLKNNYSNILCFVNYIYVQNGREMNFKNVGCWQSNYNQYEQGLL